MLRWKQPFFMNAKIMKAILLKIYLLHLHMYFLRITKNFPGSSELCWPYS
jgi:hypothetical protein